MANRRILAIVTALVMLGSSASAQQTASIAELRQIEFLVSNEKWAELYNLVLANPRLTQGDDPLSLELRNFLRQVSLGRIADLAPTSRRNSDQLRPEAGDPNTLIVRKSLAASAAAIY